MFSTLSVLSLVAGLLTWGSLPGGLMSHGFGGGEGERKQQGYLGG